MPDTFASAVLSSLGIVAVAYLSYRGVRYQARASREANRDTVTATEQETAVKALESMTLNLLEPYRDEVALLRKRMEADQSARDEKDRADAERRAEEKRLVQSQMDKMTERIDLLTVEVKHWKSMARAIARWATTLRDQVISLGGTVPTIPDELLVAQLLDERDDEL